MSRHRLYVVKGRLRIPFEGYQAQPGLGNHGLTETQALQVAERIAELNRERPLTGPRSAARLAGVVSAVKGGRVGNSAWGWSMHGKVGGRAMARHGLLHLRRIATTGARASVAARSRRREGREVDRGASP